VRATAQSLHLDVKVPAGGLAIGWIIFNLFWRLPEPFYFVAYGAVVFLIPVQDAINAVNRATTPGHDPNARFTAVNIAGVVIGVVLNGLAIVGLFLTPKN
jgi:hypothetical protein